MLKPIFLRLFISLWINWSSGSFSLKGSRKRSSFLLLSSLFLSSFKWFGDEIMNPCWKTRSFFFEFLPFNFYHDFSSLKCFRPNVKAHNLVFKCLFLIYRFFKSSILQSTLSSIYKVYWLGGYRVSFEKEHRQNYLIIFAIIEIWGKIMLLVNGGSNGLLRKMRLWWHNF